LIDFGKTLEDGITKYRNRYFKNEGYHFPKWVLMQGSEKQINQRLSQTNVIRLSKEEYGNLPPIVTHDIPVELPPAIMKHYKTMSDELYSEFTEGEYVISKTVVTSMQKCQQIANGFIYTEEGTHKLHKAKIEALEALIDELAGKPLLIAYAFKEDLQIIKSVFKNIPVIGSETTAKQEKAIIREWNEGKLPLLAGNPQSMGHGLNLQAAANHTCWFSLTWNLELYDQFNDRLHRTGQKNTVVVHRLIAKNTIDETMAYRLKSKTTVQDAILNTFKCIDK